ncbi:MAG TPA: acetate--CoA ligase [Nitrososphaeraceae archaeon]|nr:acetate--CoA ligase [Nitrososphaeraceae archaeon]
MEDSILFNDIKITLNGMKLQKVRKDSIENLEQFWSNEANNLLWFKKWDKILDWNPPFAKWFVGGQLNVSVNCVDRHIDNHHKNKAAIIWQGENGTVQTYTYYQLYLAVNRVASGLKELGINKGDRITIYLPMIPELLITMLACTRIGAIHTVVFSGFSIKALSDRVNDSMSKLIITADYGIRRGNKIQLKKVVDEAISIMPTVENIIILNRGTDELSLSKNEITWQQLIENAKRFCEPEIMESTDPLYILYTSGTTGKPKGVLHGTGGYLTHLYATSKWVFNFNEKDIFFCTADMGWVTGHSYIAYAPLLHGVTQIIHEGAPDYPKPDKYWTIIEKHGVTILYTTPTALRMYMKYGSAIPNSFDLSTLRLLGTVGEPINPEVWMWYFKTIGKEQCPIIDTWWQTETGGIMISQCLGIDSIPMKPGSATLPVPGIDIAIVDETGRNVNSNTKGYLVIKKPWPGMLMTLWNDDEKYQNVYWKRFPGSYYSGDFALSDTDNYIWLLGRSDDVLKVAGHRLSTMELESAFVSFTAAAEAAVTSKPDTKKGESIVAFLVLKTSHQASEHLRQDLIKHIRNTIGSIATPDEIHFVARLPKTRSGKIMRRLLKSISANSDTIGDVSTLEDEASVEEIKQAYHDLHNTLKK